MEKKDRTRISILLACNATGTEKIMPLVVGSSIEPRALSGINHATLPVTYHANLKAWMRSEIFGEWLKELDQKFRFENRKVLLLLDNATSHFDPNSDEELGHSNSEEVYPTGSNRNRSGRSRGRSRGRGRSHVHPKSNNITQNNQQSRTVQHSKGKYGRSQSSIYTLPDLSDYKPTNIQVKFLPANTTSHLQSMDTGIIKCFKAKYQKKYIQHVLDQFESGLDIRDPENKLTIKDTIDYMAASWNEVDKSTIANCWTKTGILPLVLDDDVEVAHNTYLETIEHEKNEIHELVIDLTDQMVLQEINAYIKDNDTYISTEKALDDNQIVEIILAEQLEREQGDLDDSDEEPPKISPAEGLNGLKTFILFTEQMDNNFFFNGNDLAVFQKYIPLMKRKITESMKQKSIKDFFKSEDQIMSFNEEDSLNEVNFSYDNDFLGDNNNFSDNNFSNNEFPDDDFPDDDFPDDDFPDYNFSDNDFPDDNFSDDNLLDDNFPDDTFPSNDDFPNDDL